MSKHVHFSDLTIAEYPMILGDHPSCNNGAPVTIGWEQQASQTRNLELYEYTRKPRRTRRQLHIPVQTRAIMLLQGGYTLQEIGNATHQVSLDRKLRAESISSHGNWNRVKNMLDKGILGGVVDMTGETLKLGGGLLNKITKPVRRTVQARSA
jgi:hypothetical protein